MRTLFVSLAFGLIFLDWSAARSEFVEFKYRDPWPMKRLYPYLRDLDEFKEIIVDEYTHPGYKSALLHTDKAAHDISLNFDGSQIAAVFDLIGDTRRLFFIWPERTIMQEFSQTIGFKDSKPVMTEDGKKIYFVSDRFGNKEIYLAEYEKYQEDPSYTMKVIVDNLHDNVDPSVDGKGSRLAYISGKEGGMDMVYLKDLNTGEEMIPNDVTHHCSQPQLSFNGDHLTYVSFHNNNYEVFYSDLVKKITINISDSRSVDTNPRISGDGNRIVFQSDRSGVNDVYMLDQGDLTLYNLTYDRKSENRKPSISADGQIVAFETAGKWETRAVKVIDFNKKLVFKFLTKGEAHTNPTLSPNGKILLFYIGDEIYQVELDKVKDNTGTG